MHIIKVKMNRPVYISLSILDTDVGVLVWLYQTEISKQIKIMLYGYR